MGREAEERDGRGWTPNERILGFLEKKIQMNDEGIDASHLTDFGESLATCMEGNEEVRAAVRVAEGKTRMPPPFPSSSAEFD
ncbi:unnamed protein product [Linum trigynum]|uniref:Uncharacterized protein n=1 Tax=Linum trigynum TaxID=586398 RepID=A0AAV2CVR2_9ROSI